MKVVVYLLCNIAVATSINNLQEELINIAQQEARVAHIGDNKAMMLYGKQDAFVAIGRWNRLQKRQALTEEQVMQIQELEQQKYTLLQRATK